MLKNYQNYACFRFVSKAVEYNVEEPDMYARLAYLEKLDPIQKTLRLMQIAVNPIIRI